MPRVLIFCRIQCKPIFFLFSTNDPDFRYTFYLRKKGFHCIQSDLLHIDRRAAVAICFKCITNYRKNRRIHFFNRDLHVRRQDHFLFRAILDSMRCWLRSTFAFQFMKADISQLPRLVILRISARSGTCLIAFSKWLCYRHHHFVRPAEILHLQ